MPRGAPRYPAGVVRVDDDEFEAWVIEAIDALPEAFRDRLGSVAIVIDEWPTPEQLASVGAAGLYGLYQGVPRNRSGADWAPTPSRITIFRGTIERSAHGEAHKCSHIVANDRREGSALGDLLIYTGSAKGH